MLGLGAGRRLKVQVSGTAMASSWETARAGERAWVTAKVRVRAKATGWEMVMQLARVREPQPETASAVGLPLHRARTDSNKAG